MDFEQVWHYDLVFYCFTLNMCLSATLTTPVPFGHRIWTYIRRSENVQDIFQLSYARLIYAQCSEGKHSDEKILRYLKETLKSQAMGNGSNFKSMWCVVVIWKGSLSRIWYTLFYKHQLNLIAAPICLKFSKFQLQSMLKVCLYHRYIFLHVLIISE